MATLDDLTTQVYAVLRDERREFILEPMVVTWINEAQRDLASRIRELVTGEKEGLVGEDATTYYASDGTTDLGAESIVVPSDLTMIRTLQVDGKTVTFVDTDIFDPYVEEAGTPPVEIARVFGKETYDAQPVRTGYERFIELWPGVAGSSYVLRYTRAPLWLEDPQDVIELPPYLETKLVNYARAQAKWQQGEQAQGDTYMSMYAENLPPPPRGHILTRPGPFTMSYEGNDFDAQGTHRG